MKSDKKLQDSSKQLNIEEILEQIFSKKVEKEKYLDFNFVDTYLEIETPKFIEIFGEEKLLPSTKNDPVQKIVCEIQGKTHICKATAKLNLKTLAKLKLLKQMGFNVTHVTHSDLNQIAKGNTADQNGKVLELLKLNLHNF